MYPVVSRNQAWLPSIFNDLFDSEFVTPAKSFAAPAVNVKEDEKKFEIEIAAPGMSKNDFSIHIDNDEELVVAFEKKSDKENEGKKVNYLRREFSYSSYKQRFSLPENIDLDAVSAEMENGVLNICLPKKVEQNKAPETRNIAIR